MNSGEQAVFIKKLLLGVLDDLRRIGRESGDLHISSRDSLRDS